MLWWGGMLCRGARLGLRIGCCAVLERNTLRANPKTRRASAAGAGARLVSNAAMDQSPPRVEQRLVDLEIKASFTEDLLDDLNRLIANQQAQIDALIRRLDQMQDQAAAGETGHFRSLRDELPPHY